MERELASDKTVLIAAGYLHKADPLLATLIDRFGTCTIRPHTDFYRELVESIIGQQLSVKAAASITRRFVEVFGRKFPTPSEILEKSHEELRSAGLSNAKVRYVSDLARHVKDGTLEFSKFDTMSNEEIIKELVAVKGIGEWTAHMFLMFSLGRLDVLPFGDLGIRTGIMRLYNLPALPSPAEIVTIAGANSWAPYQSVASWYIWKSLDDEPTKERDD